MRIHFLYLRLGDGMDKVKAYLLNNTKPGNWEYPPDVYSDQTCEEIIIKSVKAVLLNYLQQEIPYQTIPILDFYEVTDQGEFLEHIFCLYVFISMQLTFIYIILRYN